MLPEGTFLMACGDGIPAGSTGGEAEHLLTVEEMPSHDHGLSGSGVQWLEENANIAAGEPIVVLSATNDLAHMHENELEAYIDRYLKAVCNLGEGRLIIISVLPRSTELDPSGKTNALVSEFNAKIKERVHLHF